MLALILHTLVWAAATVAFIVVASVALGALAGRVAGTFGRNQAFRARTAAGYGFAGPWIAGFVLFVVGPAALSLYWSFTRYSLPDPPSWTGLENYARLLRDSARALGRWSMWRRSAPCASNTCAGARPSRCGCCRRRHPRPHATHKLTEYQGVLGILPAPFTVAAMGAALR